MQKVTDINDVQIKKLEDDLKIYETEMKKARFVYENYSREVDRWRIEVEGHDTSQFLQVPGTKRRGRSRSGSSLSNSSTQR